MEVSVFWCVQFLPSCAVLSRGDDSLVLEEISVAMIHTEVSPFSSTLINSTALWESEENLFKCFIIRRSTTHYRQSVTAAHRSVKPGTQTNGCGNERCQFCNTQMKSVYLRVGVSASLNTASQLGADWTGDRPGPKYCCTLCGCTHQLTH